MTINANTIAGMRDWIDDASECFYWNENEGSNEDAPQWIKDYDMGSRRFRCAEDVWDLDDSTIIKMVANAYAGGIAQFIKDGGF